MSNNYPVNCYNCNSILIVQSYSINLINLISGKCNDCNNPTSYNKHYVYIPIDKLEIVYYTNNAFSLNNHDIEFYKLPIYFNDNPIFKTTTTLKAQELSIDYLNKLVKYFVKTRIL